MELGLNDKIAIVTGAGSQIGFGKGIAMVLAENGCDIIAIDIDQEGAEAKPRDRFLSSWRSIHSFASGPSLGVPLTVARPG